MAGWKEESQGSCKTVVGGRRSGVRKSKRNWLTEFSGSPKKRPVFRSRARICYSFYGFTKR
ncbi:hypothetical protein Y696_03545 [Mesotoga sp. H07pep.5.4]|nr:hypothetical protein Y696_03545 [Mesotoga sp. H07pep.5.4]